MNSSTNDCYSSMQRHSKSFALAAMLLPARKRDAAAVLYAWCRRADDAVDMQPAEQQRSALFALRRELALVYSTAELSTTLLCQFRAVIQRFDIPQCYPEALLDGMAMDVEGYVYASYADLTLYCYRVASTVGLMMCHVMGVTDPVALRHAAALGVAMQLTNIARDVREDWERGRVYLPRDIVLATEIEITPGTPLVPGSPVEHALARSTLLLLEHSEHYYREGDAGLRYLSMMDAVAVSAARHVYHEIGAVVRSQACSPLAPRAVVPFRRKLQLVARGMVSALSSRWQRNTARALPALPGTTEPPPFSLNVNPERMS